MTQLSLRISPAETVSRDCRYLSKRHSDWTLSASVVSALTSATLFLAVTLVRSL